MKVLLDESSESITTLDRRQMKIVKAIANIETQVHANDVATASLISSGTSELAKRQDDISSTLRDIRMSVKQARNAMSDLDTEVSGLAERLQRLECPEA